MNRTSHTATAHLLAACALRVVAEAGIVRLFPSGRFEAARGSMIGGGGPWFIDQPQADRIIASAARRSVDIPIDYEHQILLADSNGQPAPAAGWVDRASLRWHPDGDAPGLYGAVSWSVRARAMIDADEYRYLSPVFSYDRESGAVLDLYHLALTNNPAIETDSALAAAAKSRYQSATLPNPHPQSTQEHAMDLKAVLAALGLPDETSEADALKALKALKQAADDHTAEIAALKARPPESPDPAQYVPISALEGVKGELAALRSELHGGEVDGLVKEGLAQGKLLPVQEDWARSLGKNDVAALKSYLQQTPAIPALTRFQSGGKPPSGSAGAAAPTALSDPEVAACKALGMSAEQYRKGKQQEG